jgi:hypothetical protein
MDEKNKQTSMGRDCGAENSLTSLPVTNGAKKRSIYTIKIKAKDKNASLSAPRSARRPKQMARIDC